MFGLRTIAARRQVVAAQTAMVNARSRYRDCVTRGDSRGAGEAWPALAQARHALMAAEARLERLEHSHFGMRSA